MTQVTIGGGRVVCEMDEAAQDEYKQVVGWLQQAIAERDAAEATAQECRAERARYGDMMSAKLGQCENERDALHEHVLRLRDACESVAQNMEAAGKLWTPWHTSIAVARLRDALEMTTGK